MPFRRLGGFRSARTGATDDVIIDTALDPEMEAEIEIQRCMLGWSRFLIDAVEAIGAVDRGLVA